MLTEYDYSHTDPRVSPIWVEFLAAVQSGVVLIGPQYRQLAGGSVVGNLDSEPVRPLAADGVTVGDCDWYACVICIRLIMPSDGN